MKSKVVIKLGTQIVIDESSGAAAVSRLEQIAQGVIKLRADGLAVVLVSSGAVGLGRKALGMAGALSLQEKQACAAVGQSLLMNTYRDLFAAHSSNTAQLLLTADDFSVRERYLNLQSTLETLLNLQVLPIINENDAVSVAGIRENVQKSFDDNDRLSALVAGKLGGEKLIILTNVAGLFTDNPTTNPAAKLIPLIDDLAELKDVKVHGVSLQGRGGMESKLEAARIAGMCGVTTIISSGMIDDPIGAAQSGAGTKIQPSRKFSGKKKWIGLACGFAGVVTVNAGTRQSLVERKASLLPIGIEKVQGDFTAKDIVSIHDHEGREIGRGIVEVGADTLRKIMGHHTSKAKAIDGAVERDEVIHRDNMVIF